MPRTHAPVAFFAFNRPDHTRRTLEALAANWGAADTELYAFVDGARSDADTPAIAEVISLVRGAKGFRGVTVVTRSSNAGLYRSITEGVATVLTSHERVIVVEDDVLATPFFLDYLNDALDQFESEPRVGSIHAYSPPLVGLPEYFFLPGADCWGWATWSDRWSLYRGDANGLLSELADTRRLDAFCATHGNESLMQLVRRAQRGSQSWAILWHASLFLAGRLTLHPGRSFVANIGNDGSGEHAEASRDYDTDLAIDYAGLPQLTVVADMEAARRLSRFMDGSRRGALRSAFRRLTLFLRSRIAVGKALKEAR